MDGRSAPDARSSAGRSGTDGRSSGEGRSGTDGRSSGEGRSETAGRSATGGRSTLGRRSLLASGALAATGGLIAPPTPAHAATGGLIAPSVLGPAHAASAPAAPALYLKKDGRDRLRLWTRRQGHRWIRYDLWRFTDQAIMLDAWRVQEVAVVELSADVPGPGVTETAVTRLTTPANYEYAIQLAGEAKHIGGMHGHELSQGSLVVLDGRAVPVDDLPAYTTAAEFELAQENDLLSRGQGDPVVGGLRVRHLVTAEGLRLRWSLTWRQARGVVSAYGAMLPAVKDAAITTRCRFMEEAREHDLTTPGRPHADTYGIQLYNGTNGVALSVELTPDFQAGYANSGGFGIWVYTDKSYNKAYPARVYPGRQEDVKEGMTWRLDATYRFACPV